MIVPIIKKEILNNVFSLRFLVTFILLLIVIPVMFFILGDDYVRRVDDYSQRQNELENYLRHYAHFNRIGSILYPAQPPIPMHALVRGLSAEVNIEEFHNDPLPVMFPLIDLTLIITVFLGLAALLFSYDSVAGEKEDGTLKLILSNRISRSKVILGKVSGGVLTLLIPLIASLLLGMLFILAHPRISWSGEDWGALVLIVFGGVLYISLFYCLGLFISSRHHTSSASIITAIFVWVLFVLVIPNLSPYAASLVIKTPSNIKIAREVDRLSDTERDQLGNRLAEQRSQAVVKKYPFLAEQLTEEERDRRIAEDLDYKQAYTEMREEIQQAWNEANRIQSKKVEDIRRDLELKENAQTSLSRSLSMISPLSNLVYLVTDLSSTGMKNQEYFGRLYAAWSFSFGEYRERKIDEMHRQNPAVDAWNTPVDMSDRPAFIYREEPLADRLKATLVYFMLLAGFILVFFTAAFLSFIRYDVR
ncbi:MAG: ABC transporter permease subunit [Candidatus Aminicenantes bacterium]|nr:ABC transporter permease subunit [Candidatus Aminicenantes bacterium]